jgi:L-rhamnose mutarotase
MKKSRLIKSRLKPECIEQYKEYHRNVWPELIDVYQKSGICNLNCFICNTDLIVYIEYDDAVYSKNAEVLSKNEIEVKWQRLIKKLLDDKYPCCEFDAIFQMNE